MTLFQIEHDHRLRSPREAAAWFRALGAHAVSVRGLQSEDPAFVRALVAAVVPKREHTISFERGVLDDHARAELEVLVSSPFQYLEVRTSDANLRVWPDRYAWVHADRGASDLEALVGARISEGKSRVGELDVEIGDRGYRIQIQTPSRSEAFRLFSGLSSDRHDRGFINGVGEETKEALARFVIALRAEAHAVLDLDLDVARALSERHGGRCDWEAEGMLVNFPDGSITTFTTSSSDSPRLREKLKSRIDRALRDAKLV